MLRAQAEINILKIHKEALIEAGELFEYSIANKEIGPYYMVNCTGL